MDLQEIINIRHHLHKYPELSGVEYESSEYVFSKMKDLNPDFLEITSSGTGVITVFDNKKDKTVFFRAELDALPIIEETNLEYRSVNTGIAHSCGHDGHSSILLGLAHKISEFRSELNVNVGLVFQPSEENGKGAKEILKTKVFEEYNPEYIFALHNLPSWPLNTIVLKYNTFTPEVLSIIFKLYGKTSHAAEPENGINPAEAVADILNTAIRLSSDEENELALITPIYTVLGKPAYGVSAGYAELHFTMRTNGPELMKLLKSKFIDEVLASAERNRLKLEISTTDEFKANINNSDAVNLIKSAAENLKLEVFESEVPMKWGEDFGAFTQNFKGALFGLGAGIDTPALHNPDYDFPDLIIPTGIELFWEILLEVQTNL